MNKDCKCENFQNKALTIDVPTDSYILKDYEEIQYVLKQWKECLSGLLDLDLDRIEILLQHFRWNREKLLDKYYANPASVLYDCGLDSFNYEMIDQRLKLACVQTIFFSDETNPNIMSQLAQAKISLKNCGICRNDFTILALKKANNDIFEVSYEGFAMGCNHWFCKSCYVEYLQAKVADGPSCIMTKCPEYKCQNVLTDVVFKNLLGDSCVMVSNEEVLSDATTAGKLTVEITSNDHTALSIILKRLPTIFLNFLSCTFMIFGMVQ